MRVLCRANGGKARDRDASAPLAQIVPIESVGAISDGNPGRRIGPSDLPARSSMAEGERRVGFAESAIVRVPVIAGDRHAKAAVYGKAEDGILVAGGADASSLQQDFRLPDGRAVECAVVKEPLIEEGEIARGHDSAAAGDSGFAHVGPVETEYRFLGDFGFRKGREAQLFSLLVGDWIADVNEIGHAMVEFRGKSDPQFRKSQRKRDSLAHEIAKVLVCPAFDNLRAHPEAGGRMVFEPAPDGPFKAPFGESLEALAPIEPFVLGIWSIGKTRDVE